MIRLLFVDDDTELQTIQKKYFEREGYEVQTAQHAQSALNLLKDAPPDCIILDVMMPGANGFALCQAIRAKTDTPIIFLTARSFEDDKIQGLLGGANDYLVKPCSLRELSARIQVQLRHLSTRPADTMLYCLPLKLHIASRKVYIDGMEIPVANREYEALRLLMSRPGQLVLFEEIGAALWGSYREADRSAIMVTVSRLRKKLQQHGAEADIIESVWSRGYRLNPGRRGAVKP